MNTLEFKTTLECGCVYNVWYDDEPPWPIIKERCEKCKQLFEKNKKEFMVAKTTELKKHLINVVEQFTLQYTKKMEDCKQYIDNLAPDNVLDTVNKLKKSPQFCVLPYNIGYSYTDQPNKGTCNTIMAKYYQSCADSYSKKQ